MNKRIIAAILAGAVLLIVAIYSLGFGAADPASASANLTVQAIGVVDPAMIEKEFPSYQRLIEIKKQYDKEFQSFMSYMEGQYNSYKMEIERQRDAESEGKSDAEKANIESKYKTMLQTKYNETKNLIEAKGKELQSKLNSEAQLADKKVKDAISAVSAERGIVLVLNKTAVYLGGVDITEDVIASGKK